MQTIKKVGKKAAIAFLELPEGYPGSELMNALLNAGSTLSAYRCGDNMIVVNDVPVRIDASTKMNLLFEEITPSGEHVISSVSVRVKSAIEKVNIVGAQSFTITFTAS